jgi:hypothetical protein
MARKTQGVYNLIEEVLLTIPQPYGVDIIEDVCLAIERQNIWHREYNDLVNALKKML